MSRRGRGWAMGSRVAVNWSEEGDPRILAPEGSQEPGCARVICRTYFVSRAVTADRCVSCFCVLRAICEYLLLHLQTEIARAGPGARGPGLHNCDVCGARARLCAPALTRGAGGPGARAGRAATQV